MAVLEKIRTKFGLAASIIIAIGLLSFIVDPSSVESALHAMSSKYDVGSINGKAVSYADFQSDIERMTTINEMMTGSSLQNSEQQAQVRDAAWQNLVYRNLFVKKSRAAGILVGDEEMVDLTSGSNPSPLIAQNPAFVDQNGSFSKEQLVNFVSNIDSDQSGNLRLYWNYLQESILNQQYFEKYASLFANSSNANPLMLKRAIAENNTTADVDFVLVPFGFETDSTIVVSDSEIKKYYQDHKEFYRQKESRDIEYVVYEVAPSASDIESTKNNITELYEEFAAAENVKNFLLKNSDRPYSDYWFKKGDLSYVSKDIEEFVWNGNGNVSDVIASANSFFLAKVVDSKMIPDSAYVKHILLQGENAEAEADSLVSVIKKGANFSNIVALHSVDKNSADNGELGSIGWMTNNYMIPGFESIFFAEKNVPFVLTTQYGTHVVVVSNKTAPVLKKKVAILEKEVLASKETFSDYYNKANTFAAMASGSVENYKKAVDSLAVYSHPVNNMLESANKLGSIDNTKEVTRWIYENKVGKVSNIITIDNKYFIVAAVKGIHKEGYATVNEVASSINQTLYFEKMAEKEKAKVAEKIAGLNDINAIADALGVSVSEKQGVAFMARNSQGMDSALIGAVSSTEIGAVSAPVAGAMGVYVVKVNARNEGSFYTEEDAKLRYAQENSYVTQTIIPVMMQDAKVKDNRARFF